MAKLNFFTVHVETETEFINTYIELHFTCENHTTIIECCDVEKNADLKHITTSLKSFFENETTCTFEIKQHLNDFKHYIGIYGSGMTANCEFECDTVQITEH